MPTVTLILPYFNQPTYLRNAINWYRWYRPDDPIVVLDNASDVMPALNTWAGVEVVRCRENTTRANLRALLDARKPEFYIISDPDLMPHPTCPPDFVDVLLHAITVEGFHHAGLGLDVADLPDWVPPIIREDAQRNEPPLRDPARAVSFTYRGRAIHGHRSPIDTTFALYTSHNSGWHSPMAGADWSNSLRVFLGIHLGFYLPADPNPEMDHYFQTCRGPHHHHGVTLRNTYHPPKYEDRYRVEHAKSRPEDVT